MQQIDQIVLKIGLAIRVKILEKLPIIVKQCSLDAQSCIDQTHIERVMVDLSQPNEVEFMAKFANTQMLTAMIEDYLQQSKQ